MNNVIRPLWAKIQANKYLKWCINITGAIVLGAIGSGVWENVLKPILASGQNLVLNIASWGIGSYRNDIYAQIAQGFHEGDSKVIAQFLFGGMSIVVVLTSLQAILEYRDMKYKTDFEDKFESSEQKINLLSNEDKKLYLKRLESKVSQNKEKLLQHKKNLKRHLIVLVVTASFCLTINTISIYKVGYINSAITHYHQVFTICRPFLDQQQEEQIASKFAQVRSREDYQAVVNQLKIIGENNKQILPKFTPW